MNIDELRKIADREKSRYRWVTLSPEGVIELLDRVETAERRIARLKNREQKAFGKLREARAAIERVRAVLFKRYTGSPGFEDTPEHVKEIDALRDLYGEALADDLLAALDGAPEPERETEGVMYQARCGSWDCRAPECGRES